MKKHYANIQELLRDNLVRDEGEKTKGLIDELCRVKSRGYFTRDEFLKMCEWKDPRHRRRAYWQKNSLEVEKISKMVFATTDENGRIVLLDSLKGVGVPMASAILMLTDPHVYGVIDWRVWKVLHLYGEVNYSPEGTNLSGRHWRDYLPRLRRWANELNVDARAIERSLFEYSRRCGMSK